METVAGESFVRHRVRAAYPKQGRWQVGNSLFPAVLWSLTLAGAATVVGILLFVFGEAWPFFRDVGALRLLSDTGWHPTEGQFGASAVFAGSLLIAGGAIALATPIGVASAIFSEFYAGPRLRALYRGLLKVLAGTPSVVLGLWGLLHVVPLIASWRPPGQSLLAAIIVLAIMTIPTLSLFVGASFAALPSDYSHAASALGMGRWRTVRSVMIPAARSGIAAGTVLSAGRAIGETMAVMMVCGNVVQIPSTIFSPVRPLTAHIALEMSYATGQHRASLFACGFALVMLVGVLTFGAHVVARRTGRAR